MAIEQSTNPQFVPIFKQTREVKLVYSEYKKPDEQAKKLKKQIREALKKHKDNENMARQMLEKPNQKLEESSSSSQSIVGEMAKIAQKIHKDIQKEDDFGKVDRQQKFLKYDANSLRGDAQAGVADNTGEAYIQSVQLQKKPQPVKGVALTGMVQSKSV